MPAPDPSAGGPALGRRNLLRAAAGLSGAAVVTTGVTAGLTSACSIDPPLETPPEPPAAAPSTRPPRTPEEHDATLVPAAVAAIADAAALVRATGSRHRQLARALAPLRALHAAHLGLLRSAADEVDDTEGAAGEVEAVPADPRRAVARLVDREWVLQRALREQAVQARSGPFARVLASMSAAVAQHLAALPPMNPVGRRRST